VIEERTLVDGGQTAEAIAARLLDWLGAARRSLHIALYDVRLPGPIGDAVAGAIRAAPTRGSPSTPTASAPSSRCRRRARSLRCWRRSAFPCGRSPAGPTSCT
jgi:hypothetical protein